MFGILSPEVSAQKVVLLLEGEELCRLPQSGSRLRGQDREGRLLRGGLGPPRRGAGGSPAACLISAAKFLCISLSGSKTNSWLWGNVQYAEAGLGTGTGRRSGSRLGPRAAADPPSLGAACGPTLAQAPR